ncbi:hypothetical protein [Ramlibacter albus]|uniref:Cytochrome c domain-containing protein n=1 Tax=Ramlibacter albus TaxID=2079448 RepID=A0A923M4P9_9BURK|nr:hypothetical protein [Ramlibacter albus]MBC5763345.1 hypothetical protein [Ramlibacter albus]
MPAPAAIARAFAALCLACIAYVTFAHADDAPLPARLADTGIDGANVIPFSPQYPLWSDGAGKRRWIALPRGAHVDASRADEWQFPPGTKLWKEFAVGGKPVETRYIERLSNGDWRFAAYVWNESGTEATLASPRGASVPVADAPNGRYLVPSRGDCLACHASAPVPVLGFSALQLSPDRDPLAPGGRPRTQGEIDLRALVASGVVRNLPPSLADKPPRIEATTPVERAALGYLHANCGHCHNTGEQRVPLKLTLAQRAGDARASHDEVLRTTIDSMSRWRPAGSDDARVVVPGHAGASVLAQRMRSRHPQVQMPPLGTQLPDTEGLALLTRWIDEDLPTRKETR